MNNNNNTFASDFMRVFRGMCLPALHVELKLCLKTATFKSF